MAEFVQQSLEDMLPELEQMQRIRLFTAFETRYGRKFGCCFFFLYYRSFFVEFIHRLFSNVEKEKLDKIIHKIYDVIHNYIKGVLEVMIIVGILNTIGLWLLGIKSAIFFGFFQPYIFYFML